MLGLVLTASKCAWHVQGHAVDNPKFTWCSSHGDESEMMNLLGFALVSLHFLVTQTCFMESKVKQRTVLSFLARSGKTPIECWREMQGVFGQDLMSKNRLRVWHKRFLAGRTNFKDDKHTGRPCSTRSQTNIGVVQQALQQDQRLTVRQLSQMTDIPKSGVHSILKKDLNLSKVAPKLVPKLLTDEQRRFRVRLCQENLDLLRQNPNMMSLVVTGDESWVSVLEVETKQASCAWVQKRSTEQRPRKAKRQRADRKTMLTAFFDVKGVVLAEFLPPGESVEQESYIETLKRLRENIHRRRPNLWGKVRRGQPRPFLLHHDNASSHTGILTLAYIGENNMEMLAHPPYSPDLAPCDFFLFPRLKNELRGHRFRTIPDLQVAVQRTLRNIPPEDFEAALMCMPIRWMKCVASGGEYFEGCHLTVNPEDHGLQIVTTDSSEDSSDDSEAEDSDAQ